MFRFIRDLYHRWFDRHTPKPQLVPVMLAPDVVFGRPKAPRPLRIHRPRGGYSPAQRGPHSEPCYFAHTTAPYRLYKKCEDHPSAVTWLAGRPGIIERLNGYGQVIERERV